MTPACSTPSRPQPRREDRAGWPESALVCRHPGGAYLRGYRRRRHTTAYRSGANQTHRSGPDNRAVLMWSQKDSVRHAVAKTPDHEAGTHCSFAVEISVARFGHLPIYERSSPTTDTILYDAVNHSYRVSMRPAFPEKDIFLRKSGQQATRRRLVSPTGFEPVLLP